MFRRLRVVLVAGLVASVALLGVGQEAANAVTAWSRVNVTAVSNNNFDFDCTFSLQLVAFGTDVTLYESAGGRCIGGPDVAPGWCSFGEVGCTTVETWVTGPGCTDVPHLWPAVGSSSYDNTAHKAFSMGGYQVTDTGGGCDPEQACITITSPDVGPFNQTDLATGCGLISLDPPGVPTSACPYGGAATSSWSTRNETILDTDPAGSAYAYRYWKKTIAQVAAGALSSGTWVTYVVFTNAGGYGSQPGITGQTYRALGVQPNVPGGGNTALVDVNSIKVNAQEGLLTYFAHDGVDQGPAVGGLGGVGRTVKGIGVFRSEDFPEVAGAGYLTPWQYPQGTAADHVGVVGVTEPARCAFYFGEKLWNSNTSTIDEPVGAVDTTPPVPADPTADDPLPDPTECEGLFCLLDVVGWLKRIWSVLQGVWGILSGLASAIASGIGSAISAAMSAVVSAVQAVAGAILDGLSALFVPSQSHLHNTWDGLASSWGAAGADEWTVFFDEAVPSASAGSCSGPTVSVPLGGLSDESFQPLNACSGWQSTGASMVKIMLTVGVTVAGAFSVWRSVSAGFGYNDGSGSGAST